MNNRFRKDMMKNASESKLSKDNLKKRLKEEFQHAMGGVPAWAETTERKTSSDGRTCLPAKLKIIECGLEIHCKQYFLTKWLVHLPSCTVFSNFPVVKKKNISHVHTMDFSPRSGYFALGNEKGKALMY
ncbi:hypothetical protein H8959_018934, partial [Pygathrix nigripes]